MSSETQPRGQNSEGDQNRKPTAQNLNIPPPIELRNKFSGRRRQSSNSPQSAQTENEELKRRVEELERRIRDDKDQKQPDVKKPPAKSGVDGDNNEPPKPPVAPVSPDSSGNNNDENNETPEQEVVSERLEELRRRVKLASPDWEPKKKGKKGKNDKTELEGQSGKGENKTYKNVERGEELVVGILDMAGALNDADSEWGIDGDHCLIDENGIVNLHNYRLWFRKKIYEACVDINPTDTVNLWGKGGSGFEIKISGVKSYGVGDLLRETPCWLFTQYERDKNGELIKDNGKPVKKQINMEKSLKHAVEADVFQANKLHNIGLSLKNARSKGFAETYLAQMSDGALSGGNGLADLYHQKDTTEGETNKLIFGEKGNGSMGKAARIATLGYYYLSEAVATDDKYYKRDEDGVCIDRNGKKCKEHEKLKGKYFYDDGTEVAKEDIEVVGTNMFEKVMGVDGLREFWGSISDAVIKERLESDSSMKKILEEINDQNEEIKKENKKNNTKNSLKDWTQDATLKVEIQKMLLFSGNDAEWDTFFSNKKELSKVVFKVIKKSVDKDKNLDMSGINFFSQVQPNSEYMKLVRNAMTAAIQKKANVDSFTAKYADFLISKTWDVLGMYGNNDVEIGFSLAGRYKNILAYRMKNAGPAANLEKAGNRWNLFDIKQMYVDPLQGLVVRKNGEGEYNKSLIEVLQGGQCDSDTFDVTGTLSMFDFKEGALKQYASDHMINAEKVGAELMKPNGFSYLSKGLEWNANGEIEWGDDWYEKITGMWHDLRYSFKNPEFRYDQNVQVPILDVKGKVVGYKVKMLAEAMFSEELINMGMAEKAGEAPDPKGQPLAKKQKSFPKNAMMMLFMHEIKSHRVPWSGKPQWSDQAVARIEAAFKALPVGAEDINGEVVSSSGFVSQEEWRRAERYNKPKIFAKDSENRASYTRGQKFSLITTQLSEAGVTPLIGNTFVGLWSGFWYILMQGLKD